MKIKFLAVGLRDGAYIGRTLLYDLEDIDKFYLENDGTLVIKTLDKAEEKFTRKEYINICVQ